MVAIKTHKRWSEPDYRVISDAALQSNQSAATTSAQVRPTQLMRTKTSELWGPDNSSWMATTRTTFFSWISWRYCREFRYFVGRWIDSFIATSQGLQIREDNRFIIPKCWDQRVSDWRSSQEIHGQIRRTWNKTKLLFPMYEICYTLYFETNGN